MRAEKIFADSGHTTSDVIEQLYIQTVRRGKVPIRLAKRRANIPDEALMTPEEIRAMLEEANKSAERQIASGEFISLQDVKDGLRQKYGLKL